VLQSPAIAFNPGLHQPDAIREKLARGAATMRRKLMQLSDTENRGKVTVELTGAARLYSAASG
ncbi:MAG: hypothetical protein Q8K06_08815, partial [Sulfuriferula sp.]